MRRLAKNKRAYTITDIPWLAIVLGVGIIVLSITTEIVGEIKDTVKLDDTTSMTNESVTLTSGIGILTQAHLHQSASACRNSSGDSAGNTDNLLTTIYCNVSSTGDVSVDVLNFTDSIAYIDFTHYTPTYQYNTTVKGQSGQIKIANWIPTIGLVLGAVIVITALSILFTMRFRRT